ncbi:hypothetical protein DFH09DRAFT_1069848 [Mycena vulgaris]|nr:hypothetical protein DFH09DRAFT_1069848 [Mycena vulgaris]
MDPATITNIRVRLVNEKYSIVFWGGRVIEALEHWSFHIARARPKGDTTDPEFDEVLYRHVNLAEEHLRVLVIVETKFVGPGVLCEPTYVALWDGALGAMDGGTIYLEHLPVGGPQTVTPITFPLRIAIYLPFPSSMALVPPKSLRRPNRTSTWLQSHSPPPACPLAGDVKRGWILRHGRLLNGDHSLRHYSAGNMGLRPQSCKNLPLLALQSELVSILFPIQSNPQSGIIP